MRRVLFPFGLVAAGLVAGLVIAGRLPLGSESRAEPTEAQAPPSQRASAAPAAAITGGPDFTRVAGQAVKGVANISSTQIVRRSNSPFEDPFFSYFFGDQDLFGPRSRRSQSLGSGVIVSADGYVVTNNHVVGEGARDVSTQTSVTVSLGDRREIRGRVVGTDPATDIALLKVDVRGLPVVPWGDSGKLRVGEWVLAIGSPFQLSQTVTAGIVSATGRANVGFADYEDFIQTDAAINPGNSGGALINSRGELVGINTGIFSQSGGYQGIGFAVPSNLARHVVDDLMQYGTVRRGTIGSISVDRLSPQQAEELGAPDTAGALIVRMARNSDAYEAGLRPGDIIVGINQQRVDDPSALYRLVADATIGSTASLRILRGGRTLDVKVRVASSDARAPR